MSDEIELTRYSLGTLIEALVAVSDQDRVLRLGFAHAHSYRGFYDELAFEPRPGVTVAAMLDEARRANGQMFHGWKGGDYLMDEHTDVHLAYEGSTGEPLGRLLLSFLLADSLGHGNDLAAKAQDTSGAKVWTLDDITPTSDVIEPLNGGGRLDRYGTIGRWKPRDPKGASVGTFYDVLRVLGPVREVSEPLGDWLDPQRGAL